MRARVKALAGERPYVAQVRVQLVADACELPRTYLKDPWAVERLAHEMIGRADREHLVAFFLDSQHGLIGVHTVAIGGLTHAEIDIAALFRAAILSCAAAVVLAHNHPSGHLELSPDDRRLWEKVKAAGELLGIKAADFVVVCADPERFVSAHPLVMGPLRRGGRGAGPATSAPLEASKFPAAAEASKMRRLSREWQTGRPGW